MYACKGKHLKMVQLLISQGANKDASVKGSTALSLANDDIRAALSKKVDPPS